MSKPTLAVIGAGVSGVVAAYYLQDQYDVTLLEKEKRIGGHTHTVEIASGPDQGLKIDTGFIVCNRHNYPHFFQFLSNLGVSTQASDMSFSFYDEKRDFCWGSDFPTGVFARFSHWFCRDYYGLLWEMARFNRLAVRFYHRKDVDLNLTIEEWLNQHGFSDAFSSGYVVPMGAAVWSCSQQELMKFPALAFFRFWYNHGLLKMFRRPEWRTVAGGSNSYLDVFETKFSGKIEVGVNISGIQSNEKGVKVRFKGQPERFFDRVVVSTHADTALSLLSEPTADQGRLLGAWRYSNNEVFLHMDDRVMPPLKSLWCSWNYVQPDYPDLDDPLMVTYYMNRLQRLQTEQSYFVTLNPVCSIPSEKVVRKLNYTHPIFDRVSLATQSELPRLNHHHSILFCGSYFGYGFHEDAVLSAKNLVDMLT